MRDCRTAVTRRARTERRHARRRHRASASRTRALRLVERRAVRRRARCLIRFGRIPGRVTSLDARAIAGGRIVLAFRASGTDRSRPPAATRYLVKQSRRPIRTARDFRRARSLCDGTCRFAVTELKSAVKLTVTELRRRTTYHYAVAARDNVSGRLGPRSRTIRATTR